MLRYTTQSKTEIYKKNCKWKYWKWHNTDHKNWCGLADGFFWLRYRYATQTPTACTTHNILLRKLWH